jgi:hypothetical protein
VPIFVLTHHVDDGDVPPGSARFVTDVEACADEMEIHLVPVLLGGGRSLFGSLGYGHIELELARRLEGRDVTHLRYRVKR